MKLIEFNTYKKLLKTFDVISFDLIPGWIMYTTKNFNRPCLFIVDNIQHPEIIAWGLIRKNKIIGDILDLKGPVISQNLSHKQINTFFNNLKNLGFSNILVNSTTRYNVNFENAARLSNFKRPIGQINSSLSVDVNLKEFNPNRNWRRNIKKSQNKNFTVQIFENNSEKQCKILAKLQKQNKELKNLNYSVSKIDFYRLTNCDNVLTFFLYKNQLPIAARVISIYKNTSHDIFALNGIESREDGATYFIMTYIFNYLKENEVNSFDFSRIPVGKKGADGVSSFKNSTRGQIFQYNGEWTYFKNKINRHLYYLYNLIFNKKDFY